MAYGSFEADVHPNAIYGHDDVCLCTIHETMFCETLLSSRATYSRTSADDSLYSLWSTLGPVKVSSIMETEMVSFFRWTDLSTTFEQFEVWLKVFQGRPHFRNTD